MAIIGAFYFKQTSTGNLFGEFIDENSSVIGIECSLINTKKELPFIGLYQTIWIDNGKTHSSKLNIDQPDGNSKIFYLQWQGSSKSAFKGQGFICDDMLIGYYKG